MQLPRENDKVKPTAVSLIRSMSSADLVAIWDVPLCDKVHRIEFEHGTTTGKRVIRVDGKVRLFLKVYNLLEIDVALLSEKLIDFLHEYFMKFQCFLCRIPFRFYNRKSCDAIGCLN